MKMDSQLVLLLLNISEALGLGEVDLNNAKDLLDNREYGLAFDTIITQLYEYKIQIDKQVYRLIEKNANRMDISESSYSFMKELIRDKNIISISLRDQLEEELKSL